MTAASDSKRIGVWGASGSGKSTWAKQHIAGRSRVVMFDPLGEYGILAKHSAKTPDEVRRHMRADWRGFRVAYVPTAGLEARCLNAICQLLMKAQGGFVDGRTTQTVTLLVEELNMSFPTAGGVEKCPGFAELCSRGRHYGIEIIGLSQRIAEVNTRFRGNASRTIVLRQQGPRDVKAAMQELGFVSEGDVRALGDLEWIAAEKGEITRGKLVPGHKGPRKPKPPPKKTRGVRQAPKSQAS